MLHTTTNLRGTLRNRFLRWLREQDPVMLGALVAFALVITAGTLVNLWNNRTQQQPIIIMATPYPTPPLSLPSASPAPRPMSEAPAAQVSVSSAKHFERAVRAYSEPSPNAAIGAIEPGRQYTLIERRGTEWMRAEVVGSGSLWFQVAEVTGLADVPDTAPQAPALVADVAGPAAADPAAQPTVAPPPQPTAATLQMLTAASPAPAAWDSADAARAEREDERRALASVDEPTPGVEP